MLILSPRRLAFLLTVAACLAVAHPLPAQDATLGPTDTTAPADSSDDGDANLDPTLIYANTAPAAPVVEKATASGVANQAFAFQIKASNAPTAYGAQGLPDGLSLDAATGIISGTPNFAGNYTVKLSATNDTGTGTRKLTLTIFLLPIPAVTIAQEKDAVITDKSTQNGSFVVTRTGGDIGEAITVRCTVGGSAIAGVDYKAIKNTVTIKAGHTTRKIAIVPVDKTGTGKRVVKISLETGTGYTVGAAADAKLKVKDQN